MLSTLSWFRLSRNEAFGRAEIWCVLARCHHLKLTTKSVLNRAKVHAGISRSNAQHRIRVLEEDWAESPAVFNEARKASESHFWIGDLQASLSLKQPCYCFSFVLRVQQPAGMAPIEVSCEVCPRSRDSHDVGRLLVRLQVRERFELPNIPISDSRRLLRYDFEPS